MAAFTPALTQGSGKILDAVVTLGYTKVQLLDGVRVINEKLTLLTDQQKSSVTSYDQSTQGIKAISGQYRDTFSQLQALITKMREASIAIDGMATQSAITTSDLTRMMDTLTRSQQQFLQKLIDERTEQTRLAKTLNDTNSGLGRTLSQVETCAVTLSGITSDLVTISNTLGSLPTTLRQEVTTLAGSENRIAAGIQGAVDALQSSVSVLNDTMRKVSVIVKSNGNLQP